jgi:uncharacterized protein YybS (DUF2232 family)
VEQVAEPERPAAFLEGVRVFGALLLGAGMIAAASSDISAPLPWAYGLMPLLILWLTRRVGLLLGLLAATSTLGAVYAAGLQEPSQLFFVAVLAGAGLCMAACAKRGVSASTALVLAVAPVLLVAAGYLALGGLDELTSLLTARIDEIRRLETEHRLSQTLGLSSAEFDQALERTGRLWATLLPSLFALKWVLVLAINCWLASVLFQDRDGFPPFAEFSTWRVHPVGAWVAAVALALMATRLSPAVEAGYNLAFPLGIAYLIQGFAVLRFLAIAYEVRGVVQVSILILTALVPVLMLPLILGIGFLDAWYDFRRRVVQGLTGPFMGRGGDEN